MTKIIDLMKENYPIILGTIVVWQTFLCVFFFTVKNLQILGAILLLIAISILFNNYKGKIQDFFKK